MRGIPSVALATAMLTGLLVGCGGQGGGPNIEAQQAASAYNTELQTWSDQVVATGFDGAEENKELVALLAKAPKLPDFKDVEETPEYLAAHTVADRVDVISAEITGVLDHDDLWDMMSDLYVRSNLYSSSMEASTARLKAYSAATDKLDATAEGRAAYSDDVRTAWRQFAEEMVDALTTEKVSIDSSSRTSTLGKSMSAFLTDWVDEQIAFQTESIKQISSWQSFYTGYKDFWAANNFTHLPDVLEDNAATLVTGFLEQVPLVTDALDSALADQPVSPLTSADLPAVAEPYRQALLEGYRPWSDTSVDLNHTAGRLWMLWRIRELEDTPKKTYSTARATLLEEINRSVQEGKAVDPRSGAARLLDLIGMYSDAYEGRYGAVSPEWVQSLDEVRAYGVHLSTGPTTPAIKKAFEDELALMTELSDKIDDVLADPSMDHPENEARSQLEHAKAVDKLGRQYAKKFVATAEQSLGDLDDDSTFKKQLKAAITATAPAR